MIEKNQCLAFTMDKSTAILEMRNITKTFPGLIALDHVNFDLREGEIHCVLGENGAGKTTLMNILYGLYQMDRGEILVDKKKVNINSPRDAINLGIGMIHQIFLLVPGLSVVENIILGNEPIKGVILDRGKAIEEILELENKFDLTVDPNARIEHLSAGEKQQVEILRALYRGARILIMDEPTSVLTPQEKEGLMRTLREMARVNASSIIFITHKLPEVIAVSNRVTILRKGKVIDTLITKGVDVKQLSIKMIGKEILFDIRKIAVKTGTTMLEVKDLKAMNDSGVVALDSVSLYVTEGEILGIAGVTGNGQNELLEVISGQRRAESGKVIIKGNDVTNNSPKEVRALGVAYIPEDRIEKGLLSDRSISENLILGVHTHPPLANRWFTNLSQIKKYAKKLVDEYNISTPDIEKEAGKLSGGNIQRLILARELSRNPDIILANKPTSGLDISSQEFIRQRLMRERGKGKAILLVSEDLDEVMMMSDRIAVLYEGKIIEVVATDEVTVEQIGEMMASGKR
jgi:ABC-type uncharacterized transport system ATPase subunit